MRHTPFVIAIAIAMLTSSSSWAFSQFRSSVPNGTVLSCQACHVSSFGGEGWNSFGIDILKDGGANPDANPNNQNAGYNHQTPIWANVCQLDSDGDGATNGEELGDPGCTWHPGDPNPAGTPSKPGDATSVPGAGEGEGEGAAGEGEGEGANPPGGCSSTSTSTDAPLGALFAIGLGFTTLARRRKR